MGIIGSIARSVPGRRTILAALQPDSKSLGGCLGRSFRIYHTRLRLSTVGQTLLWLTWLGLKRTVFEPLFQIPEQIALHLAVIGEVCLSGHPVRHRNHTL